MAQSKTTMNDRDFKPYQAPQRIKEKKPQFNLKAELEGSFMLILLSLFGAVFSINVLFFKQQPMRVVQKPVTIVEKVQAPDHKGTYWNPTFKLKDEKGRIFTKSVGFELYSSKKLGDTFLFNYREYDVTQKNEHLWLYALVPMIVGGISLFILLLTLWQIAKTYLLVKYFK